MATPTPTALDRLEAAIEADILATPKDELLAEAVENGDDPTAFAARMRAFVEDVIRQPQGRRLSIFCDCSATGVWIDSVCVDPIKDVGLSQETADRLRAWQLVYDLYYPFLDTAEETGWDRWEEWHDREEERIRALVWADVGDRFRRD